jgi:hypothetical protein
MANTHTAPAQKLSFNELKGKRLQAVDALFYVAFSIVVIATVVAIGVR